MGRKYHRRVDGPLKPEPPGRITIVRYVDGVPASSYSRQPLTAEQEKPHPKPPDRILADQPRLW
jgi:hypothetical protein